MTDPTIEVKAEIASLRNRLDRLIDRVCELSEPPPPPDQITFDMAHTFEAALHAYETLENA